MSRHIIEHAGQRFEVEGPPQYGAEAWLYVGDDQTGRPLEVIALEFESGDLHVIHAMPLREKYRLEYEEAKRWHV